MNYRIDIGEELSQIKNCKTLDKINDFLMNHNLKLDHWYLSANTSNFATEQELYVVANYQSIDGVFIQITFNY